MSKIQGFTVKQAEAFRRKMPSIDNTDEFLKCAQASSDLVLALTGAGLGAGLGLVADTIRPADDDEDRFKRRLVALLSGATLGGVTGYGMNKARNTGPWAAPREKPGFWSRAGEAVDPDIATVTAVGGLGYGFAPHFSRGGAVYGAVTPGVRGMSGLQLTKDFFKDNPEIRNSLSQYEAMAGGGKRLTLGKLLNKSRVTRAINPWARRVAETALAEQHLLDTLSRSRAFQKLLHESGVSVAKPTAAGFAHNAAKFLKVPGKHGRALRALALLLGTGGALYKGYDMTH